MRSDDIVPVNLLNLSGRGQAGTLAASGYVFPDVRQVGDDVVYRDILVTNVGAARVQVAGISVATGVAHFSQSNDCEAVIAAGASCTVRIGFAPAAQGTLPLTRRT